MGVQEAANLQVFPFHDQRLPNVGRFLDNRGAAGVQTHAVRLHDPFEAEQPTHTEHLTGLPRCREKSSRPPADETRDRRARPSASAALAMRPGRRTEGLASVLGSETDSNSVPPRRDREDLEPLQNDETPAKRGFLR